MVVMDRNHATDPTTEALPDHISPNIFPLDRVGFLVNAKAVCISCDTGQVGQDSPEDDDFGFHVESDVLACCKLERSLACVFDMQIYQILPFVESIIKVTAAGTSEYFTLYVAAGDDGHGTGTCKPLRRHAVEVLMPDQIIHLCLDLNSMFFPDIQSCDIFWAVADIDCVGLPRIICQQNCMAQRQVDPQ